MFIKYQKSHSLLIEELQQNYTNIFKKNINQTNHASGRSAQERVKTKISM
jgi:hypothetical protein